MELTHVFSVAVPVERAWGELLVHADDRLAVLEQSAKVLKGETPPPLKHRLFRKDGHLRWVSNTMANKMTATTTSVCGTYTAMASVVSDEAVEAPARPSDAEHLLRTDDDVRNSVLGGIDCVIIDEFQDTNPIQFAFLWSLAREAPRTLIVGDIKQAIMGFQGADPRLTEALITANPNRIMPLDRNWRSVPAIMEMVNALGPRLFPDTYPALIDPWKAWFLRLDLVRGQDGYIATGDAGLGVAEIIDALFETMKNTPNSPERQRVIDAMVEMVRHDAPWIFGFHPKDYSLRHSWLANAKPNDMAGNTTKYLRLDVPRREAVYELVSEAASLDQTGLTQALSLFTSRAAEKLRAQGSMTTAIHVFARTSPFRQTAQYSGSAVVPLGFPADDTRALIAAARRGLQKLYRDGYDYAKAGVCLLDVQAKQQAQAQLQIDLLGEEPTSGEPRGSRAMLALDSLNTRYGRETVKLASSVHQAKAAWQMRQERMSPSYTTRWEDLVEVWR